ncbi:MAG: putative DNA-binding domain-containing protein [Rhodobiaceae bacterium]|nr:putative DNA-binding domain-containing protein [Rhodobiaceae bacterium]
MDKTWQRAENASGNNDLEMFQAGFARVIGGAPAYVLPLSLTSYGMPVERRLDVYRNNVHLSLADVLAGNFPVVKQLVGEEFFSAMAGVFLQTHLPRQAGLIGFGETFPDFLDGFEPAHALPYLPDVARFEWAWIGAAKAKDAPVLDPTRLGDVTADRIGELRFTLHPSCRLVSSRFPIVSLWQRSIAGEDLAGLAFEDNGEAVALFRPQLDVLQRPLTPGGFEFLKALADGCALDVGAERAATHDDFDIEHSLETELVAALGAGLFSDFKLPDAAN